MTPAPLSVPLSGQTTAPRDAEDPSFDGDAAAGVTSDPPTGEGA
ncbi:MAG: hypothetical protein R3181_11605 [Rubricoccaceae bacterium]|nr:hypothetical protein [Rubricoccaceae bacterium]